MTTRLLAAVATCSLLAAVFVTASPAAAQTDIFCPPGDASDLQAAIDAADPGDTIRIAGRCEGTIVIRTGDDIRLLGYGPFATLDGDGAGTVVTVEEGAELLASDLTITGGSTSTASTGGGMTIAGTVELVDVDVVHNETTGVATSAGGIRLVDGDGASLMVRRGTISHNEVTVSAPSNVGAIFVPAAAHLSLDGTSLIGNTARGITVAGAIRLRGDAVAILDDVRIMGNLATDALSGAGAIRSADETDLTITNSLIAFNRVEGVEAINTGGLLLRSDTTTTIESTTVAFNSATNTNVVDADPGGFLVISNASLDGSDLTVIGNHGIHVGGMLVQLDASVDVGASLFVLNRADGGGTGGVVSESAGSVTVGLVALNSPGQCSGPVTGTCLF